MNQSARLAVLPILIAQALARASHYGQTILPGGIAGSLSRDQLFERNQWLRPNVERAQSDYQRLEAVSPERRVASHGEYLRQRRETRDRLTQLVLALEDLGNLYAELDEIHSAARQGHVAPVASSDPLAS